VQIGCSQFTASELRRELPVLREKYTATEIAVVEVVLRIMDERREKLTSKGGC
jgi:hypothetical protein